MGNSNSMSADAASCSEKSHRIPFARSIRGKLTFLVAGLVILTAGAFTVGGYFKVRALLLEQTEKWLTLESKHREQMLGAYIQQQHERVALVSSRTWLRKLLEQFQNAEIKTQDFRENVTRILEDARESTLRPGSKSDPRQYEFLSISITDAQGRIVASTDSEFLKKDFSQDPDYLAGARGENLGLPREGDHGQYAFLTAPAQSAETKKFLGVVLVELDTQPLQALLSKFLSEYETAEVLVGCRLGENIHYLFAPDPEGQFQDIPPQNDPAMELALQGVEDFLLTRDYRHKKVFAAYRPLREVPWGLVAKIDAEEAYQPLRMLRLLAILTGAVVFFVAIFTAYVISKKFTRPIRDLSEASSALAAGDMGFRAAVTAKDEVGALGLAFNRMADALNKHQNHLEELVHERTLELEQRSAALKQSQDELRSAMQVAEEASRAKSEFLANMSHEIRSPMNGILGTIELLLNSGVSDHQKEYLKLAYDSANSLLRLLNDILDFSKIEAASMELDEIGFALRETLEDTIQAQALSASRKGLELAVHIPAGIPDALVGDPGRLRQIISNLVHNAIKFTKEGEVVLSVELEGKTEANVELHFAVRDSGIGISPEDQELIFHAFRQVDSSTSRHFAGTGLGLAICSQLVNMMGGRIWVESQSGSGSTFHFTATFGLQEEEVAGPLSCPPTLHDLSVLVVDDSKTNRIILEELLGSWNMKPAVVDSGSKALEALTQAASFDRPYQLILLDAMMPGMDGLSLAERIRDLPGLKQTTIIMLSSAGEHVYKDKRLQSLNFASVLSKPVKQTDLLNAIASAMGVADHYVAPEMTEPSNGPVDIRPRRILLVEDSMVNQRVVSGLLEQRGHSVVIASDGREALDILQSEPFDLVLMDVQMPGMDGFEATAIIREREKKSGGRLPIIAITAHSMKGDHERCLSAGMDGYISKPIRSVQLYEIIEGNVISKPESPGEPEERRPQRVCIAWEEVSARVGGETVLKDLLAIFLDEVPRQLKSLRQSIEDSNSSEVMRLAHTIKSSVAIFSVQPAVDAALRLEKLGDSGQIDEARERLPDLEKEIEDLLPEMRQYGMGAQP